MKIAKLLAAVAICLATMGTAKAQEIKLAHIDSQKFLSEQPEYIAAGKELQDEHAKLEEQVKTMVSELQQKYAEYMEKRDSLPDLIRATKEKELQDTNDRIQSFQQMVQQSLQQKEQQLLSPILEKYQKAVQEVGKENNITYVFDLASQVILYQSEQTMDIAPLVKAKMAAQK